MRKANWFGHILRSNCLLKHVTVGKIEGRIEVMERRGRRRKHLLDGLNFEFAPRILGNVFAPALFLNNQRCLLFVWQCSLCLFYFVC
jgi:hypothetical protein